ncbi:MAG: HEAT repeat domain-containing protein [Planctomycetota bacterium]|jgi:HEAT repeat protein
MRFFGPCLTLLLILLPAGAGEEDGTFLTERELTLVDDALALLNMTRADAGFDKLVLEDDWRLPTVDRTLKRPLEAADVAWTWAERARGAPGAILGAAARELGWRTPAVLTIEPVALAWEELAKVTAKLSASEKEDLVRAAYALLVSEDAHDGVVGKPERELEPEALLALAAKTDRTASGVAAALLLRALPALIENPPDWVEVAAKGNDLHDLSKDPPKVLIGLGSDDRYIAPARATPDHPIAVVIDLGGNDTYGNGESLSAGAGFFGVGILWDKGNGDDVYWGGHLSQGTGVFGVGILIDEGGNDDYKVKDVGQGAGVFGIGLHLDRGPGNDRFHADLFGQGFAYVGGFGLLHNEKGNDVYDAGGVHLHYPLFNDRYQSLSQGFSIGMRPHASGGIGVLVDDAGNDRYACDIYGQGAAYWFAYGALVDRDGNDTYNLGQYGQGGGIHLATGCLLDLKGQDLYYNMHGVGTGGAHDWAVGLLVDREGDDYYAGSGGTMGGSLTNSFALLIDARGNDGYCAVKGRHVVGGGRSARGMGSIGLFLDLAGKDMHDTRERDGAVWTQETYGAGIDLADEPKPKGAPPARPRLSKEEANKRVDEKAGEDLEKLWALASEWAVGEMADVVPVAIERLVAKGPPAMEKALSRVGTRDGLELRAIQVVLKRFKEPSVAPLVEMLKDDDRRRRSQAAGLLADLEATQAVDEIVGLFADKKTKIAALDALARLGNAVLWPDVAPLLEDESERVRVAAIRCLQKLKAVKAARTLLSRLTVAEMFTVRFAAEDVLVSFGEPAVEPLMSLARAAPDLTSRRHAIRALGRIAPAAAEGLLWEAMRDPDWRVRFDAAGALGAYDDETTRRALEQYGGKHMENEHPYVRSRLVRILND